MTLKITHVRGKGSYNREITLKLSRWVRVRYLHMCTKFQVSRVDRWRENPFAGVSNFMTIDFYSSFHLCFEEFKSCFLTSMFSIGFRCVLMTGANIAGPVLLPKNTFIEQGCQFHYLSFEFAINCRCLFEKSMFIVKFASCLLYSFSTAMTSQPIIQFVDHKDVFHRFT